MTCDDYRDLLDAHLDGELDEAEAARVADHLSGCLPCFRRVAGLRAVRDDAERLPRSIEPPRDLWPGIESGLPGKRPAGRRGAAAAWRWAAAAALVVALATPVWLRLSAPTDSTPLQKARIVVLEPAVDTAVARSEDGALQIRRDLVTEIELRRGRLSPAALASLESSAETLDEAIGQLRVALTNHPYDRRLRLQLAARYRQERKLLHQVGRV